MPRFMYMFRGGGYATPGLLSPTELQAHLARWTAWVEALAAAGHQPVGQPLEHAGRTVRGRDRLVTDGPYAEAKDLVSGTLVVEAPSLDDAARLARDCPIFEHDGSVEVRPVLVEPAR